jgi:hypothetical protein
MSSSEQPPLWLSKGLLTELQRKKNLVGPIILDPSDPFLPHLNARSSLQELLEMTITLKNLGALWLPSQMFDLLIRVNPAEQGSSELFQQVLSHFKYLRSFFKEPSDHVFGNVLAHLTPTQANILIMRHPLSHNRIQILLEFIKEKNAEQQYASCFEYLQQHRVREFLLLPTALQLIAYLVMIVMFRKSLQIVSTEDCDKLSRGIRIDTSELRRNKRDYERLYIIFDFLGFRNFPRYENLNLGRDRNSPPFLTWFIQNTEHAHFFRLDSNELQQLFRANQFAFGKVVATPFSYTLQDVADVFLKFLPFPGGQPFVRMGILWLVNYGQTLLEQDILDQLSEIDPRGDPFMALFASIFLIPHLERSQRPPTTVFEVTALIWDRIIKQNFQSGENLGLTVTRLPSSGDLTVRTDLIYQAIGMFQCGWADILICAGILHIANADGEPFDVSPVVGKNDVPEHVIKRLFDRLQVELTNPGNNADSVHIIFWLLTLLPYDGKKEDVSDMISSILASLIECFEHKYFEYKQDIESDQLIILDSLAILFEYRRVDRQMFEQIFCRQLHDHTQIWKMLLDDKRFEHLVFYQHRMDASSEEDVSRIKCSICSSHFSTANPGAVGAQLPIWAALTVCGHSFCCGCSLQLLPNKQNPSMVNCPFCRKESKIVLMKNTEFRIVCDAGDDAGDDAHNHPPSTSRNRKEAVTAAETALATAREQAAQATARKLALREKAAGHKKAGQKKEAAIKRPAEVAVDSENEEEYDQESEDDEPDYGSDGHPQKPSFARSGSIRHMRRTS